MKKQAQRRISVTLPKELLNEADIFAKKEKVSRSEIIALAMKQFFREKRRIESKENMEKGYLQMAEINIELAAESVASDESAYKVYEDFLSECENCDCKTW